MSGWVELLVFAAGTLPLLQLSDAQVEVVVLEAIPRADEDTNFHGVLAKQAKTLLNEARHALRITVRGDDVKEAHQHAADALEALAAQLVAAALDPRKPDAAPLEACVVIDVLSLDARGVQQAATRFRNGPLTAWIWQGIRPREDGTFDVESFGLRKLMLREVHVPAVPQKHIEHVARFLNMLLAYAAATGRRLKAGDATSFGWVDVRLVAAETLEHYPSAPEQCAPRFIRERCTHMAAELPGVAVVYEPQNDAAGASLVPGVKRAARIVEQLSGAARQCGLSEGVQVPRAASTAVVCKHVLAGPPVEARRVEPDELHSSGWVVVCQRADHDHDQPDSFEVVPLARLAAAVPRLFSMLAAPAGTGLVVRENDELTVLLPDGAPEV